jgi:hypothetical protein
MQRLSAALRGTIGFYLRDALQEGNAEAVACLPVPRAWVFSCFLLIFAWWPPLLLLFIVKQCLIYTSTFVFLRTIMSFIQKLYVLRILWSY